MLYGYGSIMAGTAEAVLIIEGFCDWLTEDKMLELRLQCYTGCYNVSETCWLAQSQLDLMMAGTAEAVFMIEGLWSDRRSDAGGAAAGVADVFESVGIW
jgi:polyribonucleotide nucleotidyltransferase